MIDEVPGGLPGLKPAGMGHHPAFTNEGKLEWKPKREHVLPVKPRGAVSETVNPVPEPDRVVIGLAGASCGR